MTSSESKSHFISGSHDSSSPTTFSSSLMSSTLFNTQEDKTLYSSIKLSHWTLDPTKSTFDLEFSLIPNASIPSPTQSSEHVLSNHSLTFKFTPATSLPNIHLSNSKSDLPSPTVSSSIMLFHSTLISHYLTPYSILSVHESNTPASTNPSNTTFHNSLPSSSKSYFTDPIHSSSISSGYSLTDSNSIKFIPTTSSDKSLLLFSKSNLPDTAHSSRISTDHSLAISRTDLNTFVLTSISNIHPSTLKLTFNSTSTLTLTPATSKFDILPSTQASDIPSGFSFEASSLQTNFVSSLNPFPSIKFPIPTPTQTSDILFEYSLAMSSSLSLDITSFKNPLPSTFTTDLSSPIQLPTLQYVSLLSNPTSHIPKPTHSSSFIDSVSVTSPPQLLSLTSKLFQDFTSPTPSLPLTSHIPTTQTLSYISLSDHPFTSISIPNSYSHTQTDSSHFTSNQSATSSLNLIPSTPKSKIFNSIQSSTNSLEFTSAQLSLSPIPSASKTIQTQSKILSDPSLISSEVYFLPPTKISLEQQSTFTPPSTLYENKDYTFQEHTTSTLNSSHSSDIYSNLINYSASTSLSSIIKSSSLFFLSALLNSFISQFHTRSVASLTPSTEPPLQLPTRTQSPTNINTIYTETTDKLPQTLTTEFLFKSINYTQSRVIYTLHSQTKNTNPIFTEALYKPIKTLTTLFPHTQIHSTNTINTVHTETPVKPVHTITATFPFDLPYNPKHTEVYTAHLSNSAAHESKSLPLKTKVMTESFIPSSDMKSLKTFKQSLSTKLVDNHLLKETSIQSPLTLIHSSSTLIQSSATNYIHDTLQSSITLNSKGMAKTLIQGSQHFPQNSETFPQRSETLPQSSETFPQISLHFPKGSETFPQRSETLPQSSETFPQISLHFPKGSETFIQSSQHFPQSSETFTQSLQHFPQSSETFIQSAETFIQSSQHFPQSSETFIQSPKAPQPTNHYLLIQSSIITSYHITDHNLLTLFYSFHSILEETLSPPTSTYQLNQPSPSTIEFTTGNQETSSNIFQYVQTSPTSTTTLPIVITTQMLQTPPLQTQESQFSQSPQSYSNTPSVSAQLSTKQFSQSSQTLKTSLFSDATPSGEAQASQSSQPSQSLLFELTMSLFTSQSIQTQLYHSSQLFQTFPTHTTLPSGPTIQSSSIASLSIKPHTSQTLQPSHSTLSSIQPSSFSAKQSKRKLHKLLKHYQHFNHPT